MILATIKAFGRMIYHRIKGASMSKERVKLAGLKRLFQEHGLVDEEGNPTEEGQKALLESGEESSEAKQQRPNQPRQNRD